MPGSFHKPEISIFDWDSFRVELNRPRNLSKSWINQRGKVTASSYTKIYLIFVSKKTGADIAHYCPIAILQTHQADPEDQDVPRHIAER